MSRKPVEIGVAGIVGLLAAYAAQRLFSSYQAQIQKEQELLFGSSPLPTAEVDSAHQTMLEEAWESYDQQYRRHSRNPNLDVEDMADDVLRNMLESPPIVDPTDQERSQENEQQSDT
eukprot:TRINITY_DN10350_c0_g1_i1.p2 TRINITY_DN10350_c0_g1~~TRINITY_DN10350_c0_g1_i1.p2  ORF type:complete len:117 (-),score=26.34 TRINITY_DN10350_c0_g1_i1:11-361(-)